MSIFWYSYPKILTDANVLLNAINIEKPHSLIINKLLNLHAVNPNYQFRTIR